MKKTYRAVYEIDRIVWDIHSNLINCFSHEIPRIVLNSPLPQDAVNSMLLTLPVKIKTLTAEVEQIGYLLGELKKEKEKQDISGEVNS